MPSSFSDQGEASVPDRWWLAFDDPGLQTHIDLALRNNFTLQAAWERLLAARAGVVEAGAAAWPTLDAEAGAAWTDADGEAIDPGRGDADGETEWRVGLVASYEIDIWGRIAARREAAQSQVAASAADYQAAALSLAAEVATAWYRLHEALGQRDLLDEQLATNRAQLDLLRSRFGGGTVRRADLLRQRQLIEATHGRLAAAQEAVELAVHRLAVLVGLAPQTLTAPERRALPTLPPLPRTGLPVELVRRRPDVLAAWHRLAAADHELAAAISERFPRLTLGGSVETVAEDPGALFDDWLYRLAGNLVAPLIDGGARAAAADRQAAVRRQRLAEYAQTVLEAFAAVEDALVRERQQRARLASLDQQVDLAEAAWHRLRSAYLGGLTGYLDVLGSLTDLHELRRDRLTARATLLGQRIALYRALAGGLELPPAARGSEPAAAGMEAP